MGIETIVILGLSLLQADAAISQSEDQAKAVINQANLDAENKAKETRFRAARQQVSFLNSGLTLDGTPMAAIQSTFKTGLEDVNQISSNANAQAKNIISAGRAEAIGKLASGVSGVSFGSGDMFSGSGFFGSQGTTSRAIEFGGNINAQGPIQGFGGFGG